MILFNAKIFSESILREGTILVKDGKIKDIRFNPTQDDLKDLRNQNGTDHEIDCQKKIIIPGIIDIHAHLRDLEQIEKESFSSGTKAAAYSGITTVFNMPNTNPPVITPERVASWMEKAQDNIYTNVGFIAGVPRGINMDEMKEMKKQGVLGFKIYPLDSLNGIDWTNTSNIRILFRRSSQLRTRIFIHPDWPKSSKEKSIIYSNYITWGWPLLKFHNKLFSVDTEEKYVQFILKNYKEFIENNDLPPEKYPIIHFCHISSKNSYRKINKTLNSVDNANITYEITPHHLLLSNTLELKNENLGKVLPPLRDPKHSEFLFQKFRDGEIMLIGTDHAPHTLHEKNLDYFDAPSGFPGFETYPLLLLNKICQYELSLEIFVKASAQRPAQIFNLPSKGFIKVGYDADLLIIDKIPEYSIDPQKFHTKAKYSPFQNFPSKVEIWKVFLRGKEVNREDIEPLGQVIRDQNDN
ncbi:MAG: dihydroorotase [Promethearchaeia archaeon]